MSTSILETKTSNRSMNILGSKRRLAVVNMVTITILVLGYYSDNAYIEFSNANASFGVTFHQGFLMWVLAAAMISWAVHALSNLVNLSMRFNEAKDIITAAVAVTAGWYLMTIFSHQHIILGSLIVVVLERAWIFARDGKTYSGFIAGLALAFGTALWTPFAFIGIVVAIIGGIVAQFSHKNRLGVGISTALVLGFPLTGVVSAALYIIWRFDTNIPWTSSLIQAIASYAW